MRCSPISRQRLSGEIAERKAMGEQKTTHEAGSILGRLFRRGDHAGTTSKQPAQNALNLRDIQGLILRGYRMPMVRHFLLKVSNPSAAHRLLGRLVSGDNPMHHKSPPPRTGMSDSNPARETIPRKFRAVSLTIA